MDGEGSTDLGGIGDGTDGSAPWRRSLLAVPATCDVLPLLQHPVPYRRTGVTFGVGRKPPQHRGAEAETTAATPPQDGVWWDGQGAFR